MMSSTFFSLPEQTSTNSSYTELTPLSVNSQFCQLFIAQREGKRFILKCLKPEHCTDPLYEGLLRKEFEIGYALDHPHICHIYDYCEFPHLGHTIVMEYIDARTLASYMTEEHTSQDKMEILRQLCQAMSYAHKRQVIHRDLKPDNIMVTYNGDNVKIIDLGLSDTDYHCLFKSGAGSYQYAAPELLQLQKVDLRCDIYSIGAIVSKLFEGNSTRISRKIVAKCTQYNVANRYTSCDAIIDAIRSKTTQWVLLAASIAVCLSIGILFYINTTKVDIDTYQAYALPSAEADGVSEEEFLKRQTIYLDFQKEITLHYAQKFTSIYPTDPFAEEMPNLDALAEELLSDYKAMMDSALNEIKQSSLYSNSKQYLMQYHVAWVGSHKASLFDYFWSNASTLYSEEHGYPNIEYDELTKLTKQWVIEGREKRELSPLPDYLLPPQDK